MIDPTPITIPLINSNEPGALLAGLDVKPGQFIKRGEKLCTLETTKSTLDLAAETEGYVVGLAFEAGQIVQAGLHQH
jgi:biotin carboxyl carrier protein